MLPRLIGIYIMLLMLLASSVLAEEVGPVFEEARMIEQRGRLIAEYEQALRKGVELFTASKLGHVESGHYFALKKEDAWTVYFGTLSQDENVFVTQRSYSCQDALFEKMKEIKTEKIPDEVLQLARAVKLSLAAVDARWPEHHITAFVERDNSVTVYVTPENEKENSVLLGGDTKLTISPDGTKIQKNEPLHTGTLEVPLQVEEGKERAAASHTHVGGNFPSETDVALVLLHPNLAPHYVVGMKWMSRLNPDGSISILGGADRMLKGNKPGKP
jgi:hypothetical protein